MERLIGLVAAVALALGVFGPASAQNDVMVLDFTRVTQLPAPPPRQIAVFVDEIHCADVYFGELSPPTIPLGTPEQPAICSQDGAEVSFLIFTWSHTPAEMFERTSVVTGGAYTLTNWAPQPPGTPLPAYMQAYVDGNMGSAVGPAADGNAGFADSKGGASAVLLVLGTLALLAAARRLTACRPHAYAAIVSSFRRVGSPT